MEQEIWKDVIGYEGHYQVSNLGRVKSVTRITKYKDSIRVLKERILKPSPDNHNYLIITLHIYNKQKTKKIHKLVAEAFLNHIPCGHTLVVDHINDNKLDNRVENLQIVTQRFNTYKTKDKYSSKYKGVYWNKSAKKWCSRIKINYKEIYLGLFEKEYDAYLTYQKDLKELS